MAEAACVHQPRHLPSRHYRKSKRPCSALASCQLAGPRCNSCSSSGIDAGWDRSIEELEAIDIRNVSGLEELIHWRARMQRPVMRLLTSWLGRGLVRFQENALVKRGQPGRFYSQSLVAEEGKSVLVRDYIHSALYQPQSGYFAATSDAVGALSDPIRFDRLQGRTAYRQYMDNLYKESDISWFTPVEVFQPWYGYAIAEYILRTMDTSAPLRIYEIGGGTGTCASNILTYFKLKAPVVYKSLTYISVEISAALAAKQKNRVGVLKSHSNHFHVNCGSASDSSTWGTVNSAPCYVIMLEVLDNLPHDLVYRETPSSAWLETWVTQSHSRSAYMEERRPLDDHLIKRCLDVIAHGPDNLSLMSAAKTTLSRFIPLSELAWVPTGCLQLLHTLHKMLPSMVLLTSDFSSLPDVTIAGAGAPIVASKEEGQTKDHSSYLEAKGDADIFFPTDFKLLERLDHYAASGSLQSDWTSNRTSIVVTSAEFMEQCAEVGKTKTQDGYNPLLEDYSNTKFYISLPGF